MTTPDIPLFKAGPINSKAHLAKVLNIDISDIDDVLNMPLDKRYRPPKNPILKSDGTIRKIFNPHRKVRFLQRRINNRINKQCIRWPSYIYGSIPKSIENGNRDYVECAHKHCGAKSILKVDISNFFDNIQEFHVKNMFKNLFRYSDEVSEIITNICCYGDRVVQGALTSSYIASLILWDVELYLVRKLKRLNLTYTRLVDDITVSSTSHNFDFNGTSKLIEEMLNEKGLPQNIDKTRVYRLSSEPLKVHGLVVSFPNPIYSKDEVKNIRAAVHQLKHRAEKQEDQKSKSYRNDYQRILGRVNKLSRVKNDKHAKLIKILRSDGLRPKPSQSDKISAEKRFDKIVIDYSRKKSQYNFYKRYHYLKHLLFFIKGEGGSDYKKFAQDKLDKLLRYEPEFKIKEY
ncbi:MULTISPECIES: reverse transcriptase family protein [unclassified Pseudoalteromonas]|uniref:reverse transcriptase family protein n=1 Tax=unclassified Pseudoalteromonas TaxID=194690 RepID=UPI0011088F82|nr:MULTISPECIES: reverse transcriptase family protein [unclassified Pseudoalteromonas]TMO45128.1 RNA-directed DNA polymerase [Pseudoalteromonas sp. S4389]